ncbi:hypothetical protein [Sphingomonas sp. PP-CC-3A-396]|uniref:hypothetical protein n=1 Tax=Sphingomonas sp. PP-CC-3A-396 TaxID=2135655 RepID=UPI00104EEA78|nr:hypothetical protein [Sphingomonas sp. PP-CC-3A-396]TCQ02180.1 hypothetical protein C8J40_1217 [Sphingomonas sp. PP-CC-3A-396]
MDRKAIEKALVRLHAMARAIGDMASVSSPLEFSSDWYVFITAANGVYEVLKAGVAGDAPAEAWFRSVVEQVEADELLKYMYEARNDEEHGLVRSVVNQTESVGVIVPANVGDFDVECQITMGEDGVATISEWKSSLPAGVAEYLVKDEMILAPVSAKARKRMTPKQYDPPSFHNGSPLSGRSPLQAARLTYTYLRQVVSQAELLG